MLRAALLCLGLLAVTWLEFQVFPGHSYLQGETQVYVPLLQRLNTPGYLSRDLLSQTPDIVSGTVYDEVTLALHGPGRLSFQRALQLQQLLFLLAGVLGLFLLARAAGLMDLYALLLAALVNLGAAMAEPVPSAFAIGLILLAMGLFAREKPLLSGFAAGVALCYDPVLAAPFWLAMLAVYVFDRKMRGLIRPMAPVLLIFILLLANLAQLQPGVAAAGQSLFSKVWSQLEELQRFRTPQVWVSSWAAKELWRYLLVALFGAWAAARLWPVLTGKIRWLVLGVGVAGLAAVPFSYFLLDRLRYAVIAEWQPSRALVLTVALSTFLVGLAAMRAIFSRRRWETLGWLVLLFCMAAIVPLTRIHAPQPNLAPINELADWAERNTWGSSMFLFPDAGKELYPGAFRAESRRAVWADWISGVAVDYSEAGGLEWQSRWTATMDGAFSPARLQSFLPLPIDYYVLKRQNQLDGIRAVFTNDMFTVYDAQDLRNAPGPLRLKSGL